MATGERTSERGITRRQMLEGLGMTLGAAALGLGCDNSAPAAPGATPDAAAPVPDAASTTDAAATPDATPPDAGSPCDDSNLDPRTLLGRVDTIVVLMMENRSFDHYLGSRRLVEGRLVDGLTGNESNPDPSGNPVLVHPLTTFTPADPPHTWDAAHQQWDMGANDGFVRAHAGRSQEDVMGYYVRSQLPVTYALADGAAVCQRWFCSVLGPTWPNRLYLHCATSNGVNTNLPALGVRSIFDVLEAAGLTTKNYYSDVPWATGGYLKLNGLATIDRYFADAAAGTLPNFSIIDPIYLAGMANDDHPSHDVRLGQALIGTVFRALAASPQWNRSLFVLTYDENGGFFDHVPPPTTTDERPEFRQLGFRVPAIVAGPWVKRGCVVPTVFDHVSVASTATLRWSLMPLNARVTATHDLSSCFDGTLTGPQPPPMLPPMMVRWSDLERRPAYAGEHPELVEMLERGAIPRRFDRRKDVRAITRRLLEAGQRLGAVRLYD